MEVLFKFQAQGRDFFSGRVSGPAEACEMARRAARANPGVEHEVRLSGRLYAAYTYNTKRKQLDVRMP